MGGQIFSFLQPFHRKTFLCKLPTTPDRCLHSFHGVSKALLPRPMGSLLPYLLQTICWVVWAFRSPPPYCFYSESTSLDTDVALVHLNKHNVTATWLTHQSFPVAFQSIVLAWPWSPVLSPRKLAHKTHMGGLLHVPVTCTMPCS